ncbi:MAG: acetyl ornithine aminotransferase family protein [Candidatus Hodarchaeaceae archaeon]|nr:acetyl ornithine aminotransferase family protein [Candidatus Hodarchaeaceae archaeon]
MPKPAWVKGGPRIVKPIPGPRAKRLVARDERVMSPSYTRAEPITASEGWGCYVRDVDGNVILDLSSGMFVLNYGYSHPRLVRAVERQLTKLTHFAGTDLYYEAQVELAEQLVKLVPGKFSKRVYFGNSGAEAVEAAFKCARWHTRRPRMIAYTGAFHGRTFGAMSLSSVNVLHHRYFYPLVPGVSFMPFPYCYRCLFGQSYPGCDFLCFEFIKERLRHEVPPEEVAAIITEPIMGSAGYIIPPPEYYKMVKELCEEYDWLFIADEIQTGLGRTGKMFAMEHWGVVPDIVCVAKALAGGIAPIGATIASAKVMDWEPGAHASTFGGNIIACAAALEGLKILREQKLVKRAAELGDLALKRLKEWEDKFRLVGEVRGRGLMLAIELVKDKGTKERAVKERDMVVRAALNRGLLVFRGGRSVIRIAPPLIISQRELELGLNILEEALREVERKC